MENWIIQYPNLTIQPQTALELFQRIPQSHMGKNDGGGTRRDLIATHFGTFHIHPPSTL